MRLSVTFAEADRVRARTLPWMDREVRWFLGLTALGSGGIESDENGDPTGYLVFEHPDIGPWELWLLDVQRAEWAQADAMPLGTGEAWLDTRNVEAWAAWSQLKVDIELGLVTKEQAIEMTRAYLVARAATVGVDSPASEEGIV